MFGCVRAKERSNALPCPKDGSSVTLCCCSSQLLLSYCLNNKKTSLVSFDSFVFCLCQLAVSDVSTICNCAHMDQDVLNASIEVKCFCIVIEQILWELFSEGGMFSEICLFTMSLLLSFIFTEKKLPWLNQFSVE